MMALGGGSKSFYSEMHERDAGSGSRVEGRSLKHQEAASFWRGKGLHGPEKGSAIHTSIVVGLQESPLLPLFQ